MNVLAFFASSVMAAEIIISPIPADGIVVIHKPVKNFSQITSNTPEPSVLGDQAEIETNVQHSPTPTLMPSPTITPTPTVTPNPTNTPSPSPTKTPPPTPTPVITEDTVIPIVTKQKSYSIAVLGDSMVDTLGPGLPQMQDSLKKQYPKTNFTLYNYGVGATNIEYGIYRITHEYTYLGVQIPALVSKHPDIVIIESFGYNPFPFDEGALDKHWLSLATATDTIRQNLPGAKIVMAATIAPNAKLFGDGAPGLSFTMEDKRKRTQTIKQYLESTIKFANSQHYPLIDAYHPSLNSEGNGNPKYINPGDHIHTSDEGKRLFADQTVKTFVEHGILQ
jgi:lysophospholipase L1-like esterase